MDFFSLKYIMTPQAPEEEGSPVEVAKSYMRTRPPWASPLKRDNSLSPSPLAELFKERTPYSSDPKKDYLSGGTWNIQDEIRKVRSKATEDLLNSHRSIKHLEYSLETEAITLETSKPVDEIVDLTAQDKEQETRSDSEGNGIEKEEEGGKGDEHGKNGMGDENCVLLTESAEIPVFNNSQDSSNGNELNLASKAVTRGSRNTRRGRGRGK